MNKILFFFFAFTSFYVHAQDGLPLHDKLTDVLTLSSKSIGQLVVRDRSIFKEKSRAVLHQRNIEERQFLEVSFKNLDPDCQRDQEKLRQVYLRLIEQPYLAHLIQDELNVPVYLQCAIEDVSGRGGDASITISRGVMKSATNEDEIAVVLAHEIAHVSLAHDLERYEGMGGGPLERRQSHELEADKVGSIIAYLAGYNPRSLLAVLKRIDDSGGKGSMGHASSKKRVRILKKYFKGFVDGQ